MPETPPHTDASDAPEKRDIYGLYDMSDTADAADMYEAPEAFDVFNAFDPGILPDAAEAVSTDFTDFTDFTDASDADETREILSRVDSLMMRRRGVVSPLSPTEPSLMSEPDPAPETVQAVQEITPKAAPEDDPAAWAAPPDAGLLEQSFLPALTEDASSSSISAPPQQPPTEDDDLPILTDVILIDAAPAGTTQPPSPDHQQEEAFGEVAEEVPTVRTIDIAADSPGDIEEAYPASPTGEMPADEAAADLAADITRLCRERLASELPALLENLLNAAEKELRASIAAIVDDALQEAISRHQYPTLTPHAPEDGDEAA